MAYNNPTNTLPFIFKISIMQTDNKELKHFELPEQQACTIPDVSNSAYFGNVCKWCKSTKTHYDYVSIEGAEIWQCDSCKQEFLWDEERWNLSTSPDYC